MTDAAPGEFDCSWLDLREPIDAQARHRGLLAEVVAWCQQRRRGDAPLQVVDLGCGSGANARFLIPHLAAPQHWTLLDHDPALLQAAHERFHAWAATNGYRPQGPTLSYQAPFGELSLCPSAFDLRELTPERLRQLTTTPPDLITASALLDLVSAPWLGALMACAVAAGSAIYIALSYSGELAWEPEDEDDAAVRRHFNQHQRSDKGMGPALGPEATEALGQAFYAHDYRYRVADSPWQLDGRHSELQRQLLTGYVAALTAMDVEASWLGHWQQRRLRQLEEARHWVHHRDIFGYPLTAAP